MVAAVQKAKVPNMVWYNYRRVRPSPSPSSSSTRASSARFSTTGRSSPGLDDQPGATPGRTGLWRLDVAAAGSGVTGDLLAHCIDTASGSTATSRTSRP